MQTTKLVLPLIIVDIDLRFTSLITTLKIQITLIRLHVSSLNIFGFIFGFVSYIIAASPMPSTYKIGLFIMLCIFIFLSASAVSELDNNGIRQGL